MSIKKGIISPLFTRLLERLEGHLETIKEARRKNKEYYIRRRDKEYDEAVSEADKIVTKLKKDNQYWQEMGMKRWDDQ